MPLNYRYLCTQCQKRFSTEGNLRRDTVGYARAVACHISRFCLPVQRHIDVDTVQTVVYDVDSFISAEVAQ